MGGRLGQIRHLTKTLEEAQTAQLSAYETSTTSIVHPSSSAAASGEHRRRDRPRRTQADPLHQASAEVQITHSESASSSITT
jgi:hypothetical protein